MKAAFEKWEKDAVENGKTDNKVFCTHADVKLAFKAGMLHAAEIAEKYKRSAKLQTPEAEKIIKSENMRLAMATRAIRKEAEGES